MFLTASLMLFMFIPVLGFAKERTIVELQDQHGSFADAHGFFASI